MKKLLKAKKGAIMILSLIIIGAIVSIIFIQIALSGLTQLSGSEILVKGEQVKQQTESCAQEALLQLARDNDYVGGTITLGNGTCTIVVSGGGNGRNLNITGDINQYSYVIDITVLLNPFAIEIWE